MDERLLLQEDAERMIAEAGEGAESSRRKNSGLSVIVIFVHRLRSHNSLISAKCQHQASLTMSSRLFRFECSEPIEGKKILLGLGRLILGKESCFAQFLKSFVVELFERDLILDVACPGNFRERVLGTWEYPRAESDLLESLSPVGG